jgi:hypothetical protein
VGGLSEDCRPLMDQSIGDKSPLSESQFWEVPSKHAVCVIRFGPCLAGHFKEHCRSYEGISVRGREIWGRSSWAFRFKISMGFFHALSPVIAFSMAGLTYGEGDLLALFSEILKMTVDVVKHPILLPELLLESLMH